MESSTIKKYKVVSIFFKVIQNSGASAHINLFEVGQFSIAQFRNKLLSLTVYVYTFQVCLDILDILTDFSLIFYIVIQRLVWFDNFTLVRQFKFVKTFLVLSPNFKVCLLKIVVVLSDLLYLKLLRFYIASYFSNIITILS